MNKARKAPVLLAALALLISACTAGGPAQSTLPPGASPTEPGTAVQTVPLLRIGTTSDESSWNPYTYVSGYPGWTLLLIQFDTLMALDLNNEPQPWLAKSVEASADSKVWTLTLETDVKWHDGRPFTAEDVKFTIEYFQKNIHGRFSTPLRDVTSVEIRGNDTVVITVSASKPGWRYQFLSDVPMIPKHVWENEAEPKKATDLKYNTGTGPYRLVEHRAGQFYRFQSNPDYFKGTPLVDEIVMPIITEVTSAFASLKIGELDTYVRSLQPELVSDFATTPGIKVARGPEFASSGMWLNVEKPGLDRKEVRQAISLAIDRKKLVATVFLGLATVGNIGFIHPANPWFNPNVKTEFDVARANALLDGIGATRGADGIRSLGGTRFAWEIVVSQTAGPLRVREAELIGQMLKEVGIEINVRVLESSAWVAAAWPNFDVRQGRTSDIAMSGWSAPTQFEAGRLTEQVHSDPLRGGINVYGFKNAEGDALAERLASEGDPARRMQLAHEMQAFFAEHAFNITTLYPDGLYAYHEAKFDGWKFQTGLGIFQKNSLIAQR